ncbi:hypothetical protein AB0K89_26305 [Streptomyces cinnamoneus]|uniref:hypothetical protein n=1 Tax=Streptomyces cinnamoneus TaxID=53446 RepID=UPI00341ED155
MELVQDVGDVLVVLGEDLGACSQERRVPRKTFPSASRAKESSHGTLFGAPGSVVIGRTMRSATSRRSAGIRGSAVANSAAVSASPAWTARR